MSIASTIALPPHPTLELSGGSGRHSGRENVPPKRECLHAARAALECGFPPYSGGTASLHGIVRQRTQRAGRCLLQREHVRSHAAAWMSQLAQFPHFPKRVEV